MIPSFYLTLSITTITLYVIAAIIYYLALTDRLPRLIPTRLISIAAVSSHAIWLHHAIDLPAGQNISFINMLSFVDWLMGVVIVITTSRKTCQNLCIIIFPLAALSILLALFLPAPPMIKTMAGHPGQWLHVWLSAITFSIICIAALQAILLTLQDILLHRHYLPNLVKKMPALESMEHFLFQMVSVGFVLLTIVCISSAYFFTDIFQWPLLKKTLLAFVVWAIFFILLLGRHLFGWRGRKAVAYVMVGFVLLILIYFGSQIFVL